MAKLNGTVIIIEDGSTQIVGLISNSMELSSDMIDVTSKESTGSWKEFLTGEKGGSFSVEALYDPAAAEGFSEAFANIDAGTTVTISYGQTGSGETYFSASALVERLTNNGSKNSAASWSMGLRITGQPTEETGS